MLKKEDYLKSNIYNEVTFFWSSLLEKNSSTSLFKPFFMWVPGNLDKLLLVNSLDGLFLVTFNNLAG